MIKDYFNRRKLRHLERNCDRVLRYIVTCTEASQEEVPKISNWYYKQYGSILGFSEVAGRLHNDEYACWDQAGSSPSLKLTPEGRVFISRGGYYQVHVLKFWSVTYAVLTLLSLFVAVGISYLQYQRDKQDDIINTRVTILESKLLQEPRRQEWQQYLLLAKIDSLINKINSQEVPTKDIYKDSEKKK